MSRIGNRILTIPEGVTVTVGENNFVTVTGPKGELKNNFNKDMKITVDGNKLSVVRPDDTIKNKTLHGTTNSLINNMIIGVSEGFKRDLQINGVGYRCSLAGNTITLNVGYSHPVKVEIPAGLKAEVPTVTTITISGIDKQQVNEFAAEIRKIRKPEPYKGKGIRYDDEHIRIKEGKKASK